MRVTEDLMEVEEVAEEAVDDLTEAEALIQLIGTGKLEMMIYQERLHPYH